MRLQNAEPNPAGAEHRILFVVCLGRSQQPGLGRAQPGLRLADQELGDIGKELVERRIEQANGDGKPIHGFENRQVVRALDFGEFDEGCDLLVV